jgi:predicted amidohydrolase YtcJ
VFAPSERLTLDQAIRAVTIDAAYMCCQHRQEFKPPLE